MTFRGRSRCIAVSRSFRYSSLPNVGWIAVARDLLRDASNWSVRSPSLGMPYAFVPSASLTVLTTRLGRHLNCMDYPLSATSPELAALPHVGTTLKPPDFGSCLQTWNLTVVFDAEKKPPTVVAAIYDQPEW